MPSQTTNTLDAPRIPWGLFLTGAFDVHATIASAFGIPDATFGNPAYCDDLLD